MGTAIAHNPAIENYRKLIAAVPKENYGGKHFGNFISNLKRDIRRLESQLASYEVGSRDDEKTKKARIKLGNRDLRDAQRLLARAQKLRAKGLRAAAQAQMADDSEDAKNENSVASTQSKPRRGSKSLS
jgi:multidrug resistance efflux pump